MTENEYNYSANIVADITDQAIAFQEDMMGVGIERWGYRKSDVENALIELERYRKIGTVEECKEAIEKQKEKKPDLEGDGCSDGEIVYDTWICPNCGERYEVDYDDYKYCPNCGQKIDWSDKE